MGRARSIQSPLLPHKSFAIGRTREFFGSERKEKHALMELSEHHVFVIYVLDI